MTTKANKECLDTIKKILNKKGNNVEGYIFIPKFKDRHQICVQGLTGPDIAGLLESLKEECPMAFMMLSMGDHIQSVLSGLSSAVKKENGKKTKPKKKTTKTKKGTK